MNNERLLHLLAAYGADSAKWPAADRAGVSFEQLADRIERSESGAMHHEGEAMRAEAVALDDWLDSYRVKPPGHDLLNRIIASGPAPAVKRWFEHLWSGMGLGMAGVAAGGILAGVLLMSAILAPDEMSQAVSSSPTADSSYLTTAFNGSSPLWSEE
jgi:hypothetical protein